ncbi:MAG TPA: DUF4349 domain-containing protein, partial [Gaiellaceae bacterium]|nr:DUF4349 domain-containing protein [Gaiellaceae bacterium]
MSVPEAFPAELARELRVLPIAAPAQLRERVRALGEPPPRRRRLSLPPLRRTLLVLAPACLAVLLAAAVVRGLTTSSPSSNRGEYATSAKSRAQKLDGHASRGLVPARAVPVPFPARHQDYEADLRVRVKDLDTLGRETAAAMRVTNELGGYVASVQQSTTAGAPGEADLVLRVPVARVETAMIRLSALGTVLEQHVSIVDLEQTVQQQRDHIRALRLRIVRLSAALRQPLPADVRLRLQFQLDDARRALARATGARRATLREAALSRIALTLTTERAVAATKHHRSRFGSAV